MHPLPCLIVLTALLAAPACAEQALVPVPVPGTGTESHPNEETWQQQHPAEFKRADQDGDGRLNKAENAAFVDLIEAKKRRASAPALAPVVPAQPAPVSLPPGPSIGVMLPPLPLPGPQDGGPVATPPGPPSAVLPPPLPLPRPDAVVTDPQATPAGMPILVLPLPSHPPFDPPESPKP